MTDTRSAGLAGRALWFSVHKWIGLLLLLLLIPLSASGSLLVWHDWTDGLVNPGRYAVSDSAPVLGVEDYARSARNVLQPEDRVASVEFPHAAGKPVVVIASRAAPAGERAGPPPRYQVWLDPADARVVDHADPRSGILRKLHVFHGSLMVPGIGRTIVGWLGILMLVSCLTGLWLWWPRTGRLARGLRWRRGPLISGNLHHQTGFWVALPLAILSLTGAYISFPNFVRPVEGLVAQQKAQQRPASNRGARPAARTALGADEAVRLARAQGGGALLALRWPTEGSGCWTVTLERAGGEIALAVDDRSGAVEAEPARGGVARFMRQLHDGHAYNPVWQTIIFVAGLAPALLGVTGVIMWLRTRVWRRRSGPRARSLA